MATSEWNSDREYHESLMSDSPRSADGNFGVQEQEKSITPLFLAGVLAPANGAQSNTSPDPYIPTSYSFLGKVLDTYGGSEKKDADDVHTSDSSGSGVAIHPNDQSPTMKTDDSRMFSNTDAPWSAFICGSQGSGKSHTLSCMLEAALKPSRLGKLPCPLAGIIFHYDKFTAFSATQICGAVYLNSPDIPVTVLVSPSNFYHMKSIYENLAKMSSNAPKPLVAPFLLEEKHLNIERMMKLMAVDEKEGKLSLYMEVRDDMKQCH